MYIRLIIGVALLLIGTRCSTQSSPSLSGKIEVSEGWKPVVYLVMPRSFDEIAAGYVALVMDSARIAADGQFAFGRLPQNDKPVLYELVVQPADSRYPNALMDENLLQSNYMPVVIKPGESIKCSAVSERFQASFVLEKPTPENQKLLTLRNIRHTSFSQWQEKLLAAPDEHQLLEQEAALHQFQLPLMQFADTTASLFAALVATRWVSLQNDYERAAEFLHRQCRRWSASHAGDAFVAQLCAKTAPEKLPVLVGHVLPDFALPMSNGDTVSVNKLLGKKLTILDLWASWCAPCRRENRDVLAPMWADWREKGLQIIGYSIDSDGDAWRAAITKDGAAWLHASHLTGDETPFMDALRIRTIPANFLLDGNGKVVAKNVHGADLEVFVKKYLGKE